MTKHPDYSAMSADEVTSLLDDFYRRQLDILSVKILGTLLTLFHMATACPNRDMATLRDAVLEKNGVEKNQTTDVCRDDLHEIVAAVEARGSNAAKSIKAYSRFISLSETYYQMICVLNPPPLYSGPLAGVRASYNEVKTLIQIGRGMKL